MSGVQQDAEVRPTAIPAWILPESFLVVVDRLTYLSRLHGLFGESAQAGIGNWSAARGLSRDFRLFQDQHVVFCGLGVSLISFGPCILREDIFANGLRRLP